MGIKKKKVVKKKVVKISKKPNSAQIKRAIRMASEVLNDKKAGFVLALQLNDKDELDGPLHLNNVKRYQVIEALTKVLSRAMNN